MNPKPNPFSLYDFLGYFTPGSIFLFLVSFVIVHAGVDQSSGGNVLEKIDLDKAEEYIVFILSAYSLGHVLSFISSITVERYSIWAFGYPSKYLLGLKHDGYFNIVESKNIRVVMRVLVGALLAPISLLDYLLGYHAGMRALYAKSLDDLLINIIRDKISNLIFYHAKSDAPKQKGKAKEHDFFRYVYHYAVENAPNHLPKMQNYVALYGFLRTLCLISILVFWGIVWHSLTGTFNYIEILTYLALSSIISFLFFTAFVKFYRRFSLEALMAMAVVYESKRVKPRPPRTNGK